MLQATRSSRRLTKRALHGSTDEQVGMPVQEARAQPPERPDVEPGCACATPGTARQPGRRNVSALDPTGALLWHSTGDPVHLRHEVPTGPTRQVLDLGVVGVDQPKARSSRAAT